MYANKKLTAIRIALAAVSGAIFIAAFSGIGTIISYAMRAELAPALLSWISGASIGSMAFAILHIMLARFCGRVYCSIICPLGILQDAAGLIPLAKNKFRKDCISLRYGIAGVVCGLLFCATAAGFFFLDPYSIAGRGVSSFLWGSILPLALILLVTLFKRRFFCTYLCPVGTLLGTLSRNGMWQLKIADNCVNCGKCVKSCPAGCISPAEKTLDNERCLRCMQCVSACPVNAIGFVRVKEKAAADRREILSRFWYISCGFAAGYVLARLGVFRKIFADKTSGIYPPGAAKKELFERKCTGCLLCTKVCPQKIIVPAKDGIGPVQLDLTENACLYNCHKCGNICPTGAIRKLSLPVKQKLKIAQAKFNPTVCMVFQEGTKCGKCGRACPAKAITLRKNGSPKFNAKLCIGCGACQIVCPSEAFTIETIPEQITTDHEQRKN